jgi:hypothetical protein
MKHLFTFAAIALSLGVSPAFSQDAVPPNDDDNPAVVLPADGLLPVGEATNLVFIAPLAGGILALFLGGGGGTISTTSTVSTTN